MRKIVGFAVGVLLGALAFGVLVGTGGCGTDKPGATTDGTGGSPGTGGSSVGGGTGGAGGATAFDGLQFNGSITFVRVRR